MSYHTVYTFGYSGQQPATLRRHVERLGALLVDVRLKAWSRAAYPAGKQKAKSKNQENSPR